MPDTNAAHTIQRTLGVDEIRAHILADLSGGFAGDAGQLHGDANFWPMRTETLSTCRKLLTQKNMAISAYADFLETHKDRLVSILTIMQSFYRDVLVYQKTQNSHLIINRDEAELIAQTALHFTSGVISNIIKVILEAERRFSSPVNFRLAAEKMFFDILEEKNQWKKS
jgi:DNA polymerase III gamma/tau subunit